MSFDLAALRSAVESHGTVARVVVAATAGSVPREVGASMLVWDGGQSGTIGGGALEYEAARVALHTSGPTRHPLGPSLGQCCGGAVTLLTEHFRAPDLDALSHRPVHARGPGTPPLAVRRILDRARNSGELPAPQYLQGWMIEPLSRPRTPLWIWGAGHVGRALVATLAPLPEIDITWIDTAPDRFPQDIPPQVTPLPAADPALLVPRAPREAHHLILTYSHAIDLALCHALLSHDFARAGLIGSDTKRARFHSRLRNLGHSDARISRIRCPIGHKAFGKHPQAIALGVAAQHLQDLQEKEDLPWQTRSSASGA
ncbi:xanthine dehydrogenase accessory protein XdhC [Thalassococcus sp. BH17M4-6]|uniref:xanthine dehydrogenase accessory protein XdhC n=1 Tax=Thalassococcus sp. BH17M4-6 TaxID=3413148 RepID=UPI003BD896A0